MAAWSSFSFMLPTEFGPLLRHNRHDSQARTYITFQDLQVREFGPESMHEKRREVEKPEGVQYP